MKHEEFIEKCIEIVIESENEGLDPKEHYLTKKEDIFFFFFCKTLQNSKSILSSKLKGAPLFEIT